MPKWAYYNENDPFAAAWLRELIRAGHIAPGEVDERSITDVHPSETAAFAQCHFFAGIGVWSYGLRAAGWDDDRPVWTGSCPCQPFSAAGHGGGASDERHLWPEFYRLIGECRPAVVIGEQVASPAGLGWLDLVSADLEGAGYACGAVDLSAAGVGAPHIRQRLWWVGKRLADADDQGEGGRRVFGPGQGNGAGVGAARQRSPGLRADGGLGDTIAAGLQERIGDTGVPGEPTGPSARQAAVRGGVYTGGMADAAGKQSPAGPRIEGVRNGAQQPERPGGTGGLADAGSDGWRAQRQRHNGGHVGHVADADGEDDGPCAPDGFWRDADWLLCRDGKWRPVRSGSFPLVTGASARVGRLRGYGNALCAPVAQVFVETLMEIL